MIWKSNHVALGGAILYLVNVGLARQRRPLRAQQFQVFDCCAKAELCCSGFAPAGGLTRPSQSLGDQCGGSSS